MCTCGLTMAAVCACPLSLRDRRVVPFLILAFRRVLARLPFCGRYAPSILTSAKPVLGESSTADFYPTVKAALRHESADSEKKREGLGCHLGQGLNVLKIFGIKENL